MAKEKKSVELTDAEKELQSWETYCEQQGYVGEEHVYSGILAELRKKAHDSRVKSPAEDSEGL